MFFLKLPLLHPMITNSNIKKVENEKIFILLKDEFLIINFKIIKIKEKNMIE